MEDSPVKLAESRAQIDSRDEVTTRSEKPTDQEANEPAPTPDAAIVSDVPEAGAVIDFDVARETNSDLWQHALSTSYGVEKGDRSDLFVVYPPDTAADAPVAHNCSLCRFHPHGDEGTRRKSKPEAVGEDAIPAGSDAPLAFGWCSCPMFESRKVCAHLMTIRQLATLQPLEIPWFMEEPDGK